jgi:hypothetical protein
MWAATYCNGALPFSRIISLSFRKKEVLWQSINALELRKFRLGIKSNCRAFYEGYVEGHEWASRLCSLKRHYSLCNIFGLLLTSMESTTGIPSGLFPSGFPTKHYMHSSSPHTCYIPCPSQVLRNRRAFRKCCSSRRNISPNFVAVYEYLLAYCVCRIYKAI